MIAVTFAGSTRTRTWPGIIAWTFSLTCSASDASFGNGAASGGLAGCAAPLPFPS